MDRNIIFLKIQKINEPKYIAARQESGWGGALDYEGQNIFLKLYSNY